MIIVKIVKKVKMVRIKFYFETKAKIFKPYLLQENVRTTVPNNLLEQQKIVAFVIINLTFLFCDAFPQKFSTSGISEITKASYEKPSQSQLLMISSSVTGNSSLKAAYSGNSKLIWGDQLSPLISWSLLFCMVAQMVF